MKEGRVLSKEQIAKFKKLYKKRFGKDLSDAEAYESAIKLVRLVELTYKPMTKAEYKKLKQKPKEKKP
jgi:hypothetical protein